MRSDPLPALRAAGSVQHRAGAARAAAFTRSGDHIASAGTDGSVIVLETKSARMGSHVRSREFVDHADRVTALAFHPFLPYVISGSRDATVKMFDFKGTISRSFASLQDAHPVRALALHPSGDYLLVGTDHAAIRLYDIATQTAIASGACYVSADTSSYHASSVSALAYGTEANVYVSGSRDGTIKLWNGVDNTPINTIEAAHGGHEIISVVLSANTRYLLSTGRDSSVVLRELGTGKVVRVFAEHASSVTCPAMFSHNERNIVIGDERSGAVVIYDVLTGELVARLANPANEAPTRVRWAQPSPVDATVAVCREDGRVTVWTE